MKVSVAIVTYNHERFIARTLDSALMQRTNFAYEIVIGEDCSTDNTRKIIEEYDKKYPGRLTLLLNEKNLGMHGNGARTLAACTGDYVAKLDGDDYWTSPEKLQKQADFLDDHPECSACFHDVLIVHEDGSADPIHRPSQKRFSTVEDLLLENYIPTCSVMFRKGLFDRLPDWVATLKMGDWPLHILNALHGKIGHIDECMAVYVIHPGGAWSMKNRQFHALAEIGLYEALDAHLDRKYSKIINYILRWRYFVLSEQYRNNDEIVEARYFVARAALKHLVVLTDKFIPGDGRPGIPADYAACNWTSVKTRTLIRSMLSVYVAPILRSHTPTLFRLLKAVVK